MKGTLVADFDGELKPIEEHKNVLISEQDEIEILKVTFSNGEVVYQSANHPIWSFFKELSLPKLGLDCETNNSEHRFLEIVSIEKQSIEPQRLYNIDSLIVSYIEVGNSRIMYADAETCLKFNNENKRKEHRKRVAELSEI